MTERKDGRCPTTAAFVQHLMRCPPALGFDPGFNAESLAAWRAEVRTKLRELLAFPDVPPQPQPRLIAEEPRDGYRLQRWELYPEPASVVPFVVLVPDEVSAKRPAPAVLCFPGSQQPKEALCGEPWPGDWQNRFGEHNYMALHMVKAGFIALAMDNPATGELDDPELGDWRRQSGHLIWLGRTYEGLSTFQKMVAFQWLREQATVDAARVAVCGHSLGAKPALLLGVLEESVAAVVWNDHASDWRERAVLTKMMPIAPWHYIPGFMRWFDYMDLMCAFAPRPLLITEGGHLKDHERIRTAYRTAGAESHLKVTFMPNFSEPAARCDEPTPEGLTREQYARYANYDTDHYFKEGVAVPWLSEHLKQQR